jgi:hypothetical protein
MVQQLYFHFYYSFYVVFVMTIIINKFIPGEEAEFFTELPLAESLQ